MNHSVVYFTDRTPNDNDPLSFWIWEEFNERARSGSDVFVYLINVEEKDLPADLHSRIHLRSALKKRTFLRWEPFIQGLLATQASSVCLIEPKVLSAQLWPLLAIPNLKQIGLFQTQISALLFSANLKKGLPLYLWQKSCDLIFYTHPHYRISNSLKRSQRVEQLAVDPHIFPKSHHWSLQDLENLSLIPGALSDLIQPQRFLDRSLEMVTKNPDWKFLFLNGFGHANAELKSSFLTHPLASHFLFPEGLTSTQKGYALFKSKNLMADEVVPYSSLAGLALKLILDRQQISLEEKRVYGLL